MEYRRLGKSGLQVSAIGLGTNTFGNIFKRALNAGEAGAIVHKALDLGINFVDTADVYSRGISEEYIGKAIKGRRREVVIATKFASPMGQGPNWSGGSRAYILSAVEDSLRRLDTDYIDLYQMHRPDPVTPIEETLRALDDLVRQGKVRYLGGSNFAGWQIADVAWTAKAHGFAPFISEQPQYNLLVRDIEREIAPACQRFGLGIIPWGPLAGGFLTGKYRRGQPLPDEARLSGYARGAAVLSDRNYDFLEKLESFARERGHTVQELAVAWLLRRPGVATVIAGATRPEQVEQNVKAAEWVLSDDEMKALDELPR